MKESADREVSVRSFTAPRGAERDLTFRAAILRLTRRSMFLVGMLGLAIPAVYVLSLLVFMDKQISWKYDEFSSTAGLLIWDKLLIMLLGAASLVLSLTRIGPKFGRLMVGLIIVLACMATLMDDLARGDVSLTVAWLALILFVSLTVPYRLWHTLVIGAAVIGGFVLCVSYASGIMGWPPSEAGPEFLIFLVLVTVACSGISGLLYGSLYYQHQARRMLAATNRELLRTQAQLVQSAKMASLGNLVAGIAHEINTPLGAIHSNSNLAARALDKVAEALDPGEEIHQSLRVLRDMNAVTQKASGRIDTVIRALRNFARLDEAERKRVDLHEGIESALTVLPQPAGKNISVVRRFGELPEVSCFPSQVNQVVMNLVLNSMEAIDSEGTVTITTRRDGDGVVVDVADTGCGIPPQDQQRVFDPGYTTKGVGVGTGLGLSICHQIVESHGGRIDLTSKPGEGTVVTVRLPIGH
ncbi:MAG: hypothetical protein JSW34_03100 [Candidatus Zixiibacteriota bacterium]|nr:MAG: hypothetical protein JSW34_03100 [candidate division Zixibacteria bacterium]